MMENKYHQHDKKLMEKQALHKLWHFNLKPADQWHTQRGVWGSTLPPLWNSKTNVTLLV